MSGTISLIWGVLGGSPPTNECNKCSVITGIGESVWNGYALYTADVSAWQ